MADPMFTPGPWLVQADHGEYEIWTRQPHTGTLARAYADDINGDFPAEANAHLIAAAPRLYAALSSLVDQDIEFNGESIVIRCGSHGVAIERARNARDALAKARGDK